MKRLNEQLPAKNPLALSTARAMSPSHNRPLPPTFLVTSA